MLKAQIPSARPALSGHLNWSNRGLLGHQFGFQGFSFRPGFNAEAIPPFVNPASDLPPLRAVGGIGEEYYVGHLGFFCKKEIEIEKVTRIPFRFRLGSLEECNRLEGK